MVKGFKEETIFNISTNGANLDTKITDEEAAISKILEHLAKQNKRVLINVDEVANSKNIREFANAFQIFVRDDLPVFILMSGLYENVRDLQNEEKMTFLYRAPRIELGPLSLLEIERKHKEVFSLSDEDTKAMARLTNGYAFAFQVLGFLTCRHEGDYKKALGEYRFYLEEYCYTKIWSELSLKDQRIVYGIAKAKSNKTKDILSSCSLNSNEFNPYRKRLVDKGVIDNKIRGLIKFVLPLFKEFAIDRYEEEME